MEAVGAEGEYEGGVLVELIRRLFGKEEARVEWRLMYAPQGDITTRELAGIIPILVNWGADTNHGGEIVKRPGQRFSLFFPDMLFRGCQGAC